MSWNTASTTVKSLGSTAARPGSLAGLAAARREHLSQFFTPSALTALMWRIAGPSMDRALIDRQARAKLNLLDNSVGSGCLLSPADPDKHRISGVDIHTDSITALMQAAESAGFDCDFLAASLADVKPSGFHCAFINPPFSITLRSPFLTPYDCTSYGPYGPATSAPSHAYALEQALDAAQAVIAVLPLPYAKSLLTNSTFTDRLQAVIQLPQGSFKEEGTDVAVGLAVFGRSAPAAPAQYLVLSHNDADLPEFDLDLTPASVFRPESLRQAKIDDSAPIITLPVTGDTAVKVGHTGRKLVLKFACGLTQAQVMNAILAGPVPQPEAPHHHRYPKGVRFVGQGKLDLETYFAQPDPLQALEGLAQIIRDAGGTPQIDSGLPNFIARRHRRNQRELTPYRHTVKTAGHETSQSLCVRPKKALQINPAQWGSAVLKPTDALTFTRDGNTFTYTHPNGEQMQRDAEELKRDFDLPQAEAEWKVVHEGRVAAFPQLAQSIRAELTRAGLDSVITWDFQIHDTIEMLMAPRGVNCWTMGLGKSRLAIALCLARGQKSLLVVESHLIPEMVSILCEAGIDPALYQVITRPEQCQDLKRISIISYNRLRRPICEGAGRRTYARLLRRRAHTVVCDEAHLLRNPESLQSQAVWMLSPKVRYAMTGTPVANYVRDTLALAVWAKGDGTATQPYGRFHPYLNPSNHHSMAFTQKGVEVFQNRHVVLEWCTYEFQDTMRGAKREVPKVRNREMLKDWASTILKRRTTKEPEVARYIRTPDILPPVVHAIPFDKAHLRHYLKTVDEFRTWFIRERKQSQEQGNNINLIALLARINAVRLAGNVPHEGAKDCPVYSPITSKQRFCLERIKDLVGQGHKLVVYAENPGLLDRMQSQLDIHGISSVVFHGGLTIKARTRDLNERFRQGNVQVLLASKLCVQTGLNLYQADRGIFYDRSWASSTEMQAMSRLLRPQQMKKVQFEFLHLQGSLDNYQAQMCDFKKDSTDCIVDFLDPEFQDEEFLHLDKIINQFVEDMAKQHGMDHHEFREFIKAA